MFSKKKKNVSNINYEQHIYRIRDVATEVYMLVVKYM